MRSLSTDFQDHITGQATTLCWLWRLTRTDGHQMGFSDHDVPLTVDGLTYTPRSGLTPGAIDNRLGFSIDNGSVQGALDSDQITAEDINAGLYDQAVINSFRVNWRDVSQIVHMASGRLGTIRQRGNAFEAEWVGHGAVLERSVGRVFSRLCDAELGDVRCGLNLEDFPPGTVCPRTFEACRDQFGNTEQFRGFPYLIGDDALQAAPQEGEIRDGGSRYR